MNRYEFSLQPFNANNAVVGPAGSQTPSNITITGIVSRKNDLLAVEYRLAGPLTKLLIPATVEAPCRKDDLWKDTCFEFFLGTANSDCYREFNMSPAGTWNVYVFEGYRKGMKEDKTFSELPFSVLNCDGGLKLNIEVNLENIDGADQSLIAGISAVIKDVNGQITYWALTHCGPEPDFHRKDSFMLKV